LDHIKKMTEVFENKSMVQVAHVKSGNMKKNTKFRTEAEQDEIVKRALAMSAQTEPADLTEGRIVAVKIASTVLDCDIWLAFRDDFKPDEGEPLAIFYGDELPLLRHKSPKQLREIHKVKLAFGPGSRVRQ
jgi:hypothetical protein